MEPADNVFCTLAGWLAGWLACFHFLVRGVQVGTRINHPVMLEILFKILAVHRDP